MAAFSTIVSFSQPIATHDFTIFLFDTRFHATCAESSCKEHCCFCYAHCPEVARRQDVISATQCVIADSTGKTWSQPVAARA